MNIVLTCPLWLESLAKKELELLWLPILNSQDKQITTAFSDENLAKVNLWSRVWNKVYIELVKKNNIDTFDKLFDLIKSIKWADLILEENPIIINATSIWSQLESIPWIQKIWKKAIVDSLTNWFLRENDKYPSIFVEIVLIKDTCQILIDSSWDPLHKRWYRKQSVEAPLRENLAAWLVLLSSWRFRENFYDLFCWSWTIVIEAWLIAKNIAPWLNRNFAFEKFKFIKPWVFESEKNKAKEKIMNKTYNIFASDFDEDALIIAQENANIAWVWDLIKFEKIDFRDFLTEKDLVWTIVSNPPYWLRLQDENIDKLYKDISLLLNKNRDLRWWVITDYQFWDLIKWEYKKRKLYNWWKMCYFYIKK